MQPYPPLLLGPLHSTPQADSAHPRISAFSNQPDLFLRSGLPSARRLRVLVVGRGEGESMSNTPPHVTRYGG